MPFGRLPLDAYLAAGARRGVAWTDLRRAVFGLMWRLGAPIGAYEIRDRLSAGENRRKVHLASVYRCLRCFEGSGLVIPVLTWKRYLLSPDPAVSLWGLLLCARCERCQPIDLSHEVDELDRLARARGFSPRHHAVECAGRCRQCAGGKACP